MMFAYWALTGLLVGWAGGRLMASESDIPSIGLLPDLVWGLLGSIGVGWGIRLVSGPPAAGLVEAILGGVLGALAATFAQRAYASRSPRAPARP